MVLRWSSRFFGEMEAVFHILERMKNRKNKNAVVWKKNNLPNCLKTEKVFHIFPQVLRWFSLWFFGFANAGKRLWEPVERVLHSFHRVYCFFFCKFFYSFYSSLICARAHSVRAEREERSRVSPAPDKLFEKSLIKNFKKRNLYINERVTL